MANFAALAAARRAVLLKAGWNVEEDGFDRRSADPRGVGYKFTRASQSALLLGFGRARVERVTVDDQGVCALIAADLPARPSSASSGNVNTGAFDPAREICAAARDAGAWVHLTGFGWWAAATRDWPI